MKIKIFCFTLILFTSFYGLAQINHEKGKIIFKSGENLYRTISYFSDSPSEILIYDSLGQVSDILPGQIGIMLLDDGRKFVSKKFNSGNDTSEMILQCIIESPGISLYTTELRADHQYYVCKNDVLYKLENNEIILNNAVGTYKTNDNKYIGTLKALMADQPEFAARLDKIKLSENDIIDVITQYNKGNLTYFWREKVKTDRKPFWVLLGQYCNYGSYSFGEATVDYSFGILTGVQYYFYRGCRHSFRFTLDYSKYSLESPESGYFDYTDVYKTVSLGCRYEYDFIKANNYCLYLLVHLGDVTYYSEHDYGNSTGDNGFYPVIRLSPGLGAEVKPFPRLGFYAEVNNLMRIDAFPKSFSLGFKYDLSQTKDK